jgi:hypothetical protein
VSAGSSAVLTAGAAPHDAKRIGVLFMIGSACFAVASIPGIYSSLPESCMVIYFIGSIFFTTAAFEQLRTARGRREEVWSAAIQFGGTILFNVSTFAAIDRELSADATKHFVWSPDAYGSVCFLVSSALAVFPAWKDEPLVRRSALFNLAGSVAFGASAIASYLVPETGDLLDASLATSMTLVGAVCFFRASRLLVSPPRLVVPERRLRRA